MAIKRVNAVRIFEKPIIIKEMREAINELLGE